MWQEMSGELCEGAEYKAVCIDDEQNIQGISKRAYLIFILILIPDLSFVCTNGLRLRVSLITRLLSEHHIRKRISHHRVFADCLK